MSGHKVLRGLFYILIGMHCCWISTAQNDLAEEAEPASLLGYGFDIRTIDPLDWPGSAKDQRLILSTPSQNNIEASNPPQLHTFFISTPYAYEKEVLFSDSLNRPYRSQNSTPFYKQLKDSGEDHLLLVYTTMDVAVSQEEFGEIITAEVDSALVADFDRLGRDITPWGFIARYGSHYAYSVIQGGHFILRNAVPRKNFVYSPYNEKQFQEALQLEIAQVQQTQNPQNPYLDIDLGNAYTVGGDESARWVESWKSTVAEKPKTIHVTLAPWTQLFTPVNFPEIDSLGVKQELLQTAIDSASTWVRSQLKEEVTYNFYEKFSLRFRQKVTSIVKKSFGRDDENPTDFTGDIFLGGFTRDNAILNNAPLIEYGGIRLETLITDEEIKLNRVLEITVKPEDLDLGYASVWDDSKKLFKSDDRRTLRVSGTEEAQTPFREALIAPVEKKVTLTSVDKDVYEITYTLELINDETRINSGNSEFNYVQDTELVAAASTGDIERIRELFAKGASPVFSNSLSAAIQNHQPTPVLNVLMDYGVQPTTADLDLLFDPDYFQVESALSLLERGAKPKNNMIYKAVAYKEPGLIYALFREGALPVNNDLAFALKTADYPVVKAMMSQEFEDFAAGKRELALAVVNNDVELARQFIRLGSTADAKILAAAAKKANEALLDAVVSVTDPDNEALKTAAELDNFKFFELFINKKAKLETNEALAIATKNNNKEIVALALKSGADASEALQFAIEQDQQELVELSLENDADPDAAFAYAVAKGDEALFNKVLKEYGGTPEVALEKAVAGDAVPMAQTVIKTKAAEVDTSSKIDQAVKNKNLEMVTILVDNQADPSMGMAAAVENEQVEITNYLIEKGANTTAPELIKNAVKSENVAMTRLLLSKGKAQANDAMNEAAETGNIEIAELLLEEGAEAQRALKTAINKGDGEMARILIKNTSGQLTEEGLVAGAARNGDTEVIQMLLEKGLPATEGLVDAILYKNPVVLEQLLNAGAQPEQQMLFTAIDFEFVEGVRLLLDNGLNPEEKFEGQTPLHALATISNEKTLAMAKLLLERNIEVDIPDNEGSTPLHLAVRSGERNLPMIRLLISAQANLKAQNKSGQSVLDLAAGKEVRSTIKNALRG
ncbi:ankyrin repeat domain-containing protein [Croceiramulus getboli]|nr:ankyrin repeat domain-containing protein [Flavobacteriaceae bacterium YJPT1-3]